MGNNNTKLTPEFQKAMDFYAFNKDMEDYRFGRAQLWTKKGTKENPEYALVKEKWSMNEKEYLQSQNYMKDRVNIKSDYLTNVIASASHVDSSWCSKYYKTLVAVEYSQENLAEELHRRRRLTRDDPGKWMSEPEMWYVIRAVSNGSAALASHGLLHGDIQPRNILIMPDETIKLFEAPLLTQYFTGYTRQLQETDYCAALSPQELDALRSDYLYRSRNPGLSERENLDSKMFRGVEDILEKNKIKESNPNIKKHNLDPSFPDYSLNYKRTEADEVFSIGITALSTACNNPITDFYDIQTLHLNKEKIGKKLTFMRELNYSPQLVGLVEGMLQENPAARPTLAQILMQVDRPETIINAQGQPIPRGNYGQPQNYQPNSPPAPTNVPIPPPQQQPAPLNPGMAAFQSGVPQFQPQMIRPQGGQPGPQQVPQQGPGMVAFNQGPAGSNFGGSMNQGPYGQPSAQAGAQFNNGVRQY